MEHAVSTFTVTDTVKLGEGYGVRGKLTTSTGVTREASYPPGWGFEDPVFESRLYTSDAESALIAADLAEAIAYKLLSQTVTTRFIVQSGTIRQVGLENDSTELDT